MTASHSHHRPALLAALLAVLLYATTLWGTYVYDDEYIAHLDPRLHDVHKWDEYLTKGYFKNGPDRLWRPLTSYSFAIEWLVHGDRPWLMHAVNVALYAAVCAAVAELARRAAGQRTAYVAAVLFAVHPVHVEAVAYLVGRADLMSTLGIVVAINLFLRRPLTTARAVAICACMVLAILSKEPGMLLPPVLLAWLPFRKKRDTPPFSQVIPLSTPPVSPDYAAAGTSSPALAERRASQLLLLLLTWTLAAYIVFREQSRVFKFSWDPAFLDPTVQPLILASKLDRWLLPFSLLGRYVQLLVVPWRLSIDYSGWTGPALHWSDPFFHLGLATVVAWWVALFVAIRRRAYAVIGALVSLVLSYSIVSNFGILIGANFGERLIFLPSVFFVLLLSIAAARLPARALVPLLVLVGALAAIRVETYAWRWHEPMRLYSMCADEQPTSPRLPMLMSDRYYHAGDLDSAAAAIARACAANPEYWETWWHAAQIAAERGRPDEARAFVDKGLSLKRTDPGAFGAVLVDIAPGGKHNPAPATRPITDPATAPSRDAVR